MNHALLLDHHVPAPLDHGLLLLEERGDDVGHPRCGRRLHLRGAGGGGARSAIAVSPCAAPSAGAAPHAAAARQRPAPALTWRTGMNRGLSMATA